MNDSVAMVADPRTDDHERRLDEHERRIGSTETSMVSIQIKLVEVQTEGRMRGERQDLDTQEIKSMVGDLLGAVKFFKAAFKWICGSVAAVLVFIALYGDKLLTFWRDWHHT